MSGFLGGDLAQMQHLEAQFRAASSTVVDLQGRVDRALADTSWTGPAADRFREAWSSRFHGVLTQLRSALDENAQVVAGRRQAIEAATH